MDTTVLCDKNDILLVKSFTEDEDEKFTITFNCNYDESSNIFKIISKGKFYQLLFQLNGDLLEEYNYEKNENDGGRALFYFKEKYENNYIGMCFDDKYFFHDDNHVVIEGKQNDFNDFKSGYKKFEANETLTEIELDGNKLNYKFSIIIGSDDLVNDILAMMIKKQMFRLKKYLEKD
jgi:hypothetical protein